jgi:hypothetical protein
MMSEGRTGQVPGVRTLDKTANEPSLRSISGMLAQIAGRLDAIENLLGKTDTILYRMTREDE